MVHASKEGVVIKSERRVRPIKRDSTYFGFFGTPLIIGHSTVDSFNFNYDNFQNVFIPISHICMVLLN